MGTLSALPALNAAPPPDPLANLQRLLAIKQMFGQQQTQQLQQQSMAQENQQRQQAIQDSAAMTAAYKEWDGKDPNDLAKAVTANGGSANARTGIEQHYLNLRKTYSDIAAQDATTGSKTLETIKGKQDLLQGSLDNVRGLPDEQIAQGATSAITDAAQKGLIDQPHAQQLTQSIQGKDPAGIRDAINMYEKELQSHSSLIADAEKTAATAKDTQQANEAAAGAAAKKLEALWYQQHPEAGAPGVPAETASAADWLSKNPGKGLSDYNIAMKQVPAKTQYELAGSSMTPDATELAARNYLQTGQMPSGMRSPAMSSVIISRAAQIAKEEPAFANLATNKAVYEANAGSLKSLQKNFDQVTAFENTAGKNLDTFLNTAKKIVDSGSPLVNRPLRSVTNEVAGSENMAAFNAARTTALTEIAKVLNSSNASGVLSDSARSEVSGLIGKDATLKQIYSAANILKQDMANRHQSYQEQISDIQGRMGGKMGGNANQSSPGSSFSVTAPNGKTYNFPDQASADAFKQKAGIK